MKPPTISIVIPVYNGSEYIDDLLTQFVQQECRDIELVFVDDGSTDSSYEMLLDWKHRVPFAMTVHRQENRGCSVARNVGMALAGGAYLAFVDVDDAVSGDYVKVLYGCAEQEQDVTVFGTQRIARAADRPEDRTREIPVFQQVSKQEMLMRFWSDPTRLGVYNLLLRREYIAQLHARFPEGYSYYEDYDFLLQVFAQTDRICITDRILYYYIMREGSAMARFRADRITCLSLMDRRARWLEETAPDFAPVFRKWGVSRLYWSVLWQAALAFQSFREFSLFANITEAGRHLKKLERYPDLLVRVSNLVFACCPYLYWRCARFAGGRKSKVVPVCLDELEQALRNAPQFD